jgi:hypothetical protein
MGSLTVDTRSTIRYRGLTSPPHRHGMAEAAEEGLVAVGFTA